MRIDEMELEPVPLGTTETEEAAPAGEDAPRFRRLLALLTDLSLFAALVLALLPLLPANHHWTSLTALSGFVVVLSYYYFVGTWLLWGKTVGGAIFDVRIVADGPMALTAATQRWAGVYLSLATGGIGFLMAALPSRL